MIGQCLFDIDLNNQPIHKTPKTEGDGRLGHAAHAPYDAIHVGAAAPTVPMELLNQLKPGGRMICPVGPQGGEQFLEQFDRDAVSGEVRRERLMGVMYVPLTDLRRT